MITPSDHSDHIAQLLAQVIDINTSGNDWRDDAVCAQADPEAFFPEKASSSSSAPAKQLCGTCPVRADCLAYALVRNERFGIWGGFTERERRTLARHRNQSAAAGDTSLTRAVTAD